MACQEEREGLGGSLLLAPGLPEDLTELTDDTLIRATFACLESGGIMPILKEELKCRIQSRRLSEGKEELHIAFNEPVKRRPRLDEVERLNKRREQNRRAAQKFRQKKRERTDFLLKEYRRLESMNTNLRDEIEDLNKEVDQLTDVLTRHCHDCRVSPHLQPSP